MLFRTIKQAIFNTLVAAEAGRYNTIGAQRQVSGANELEIRFVKIFYETGDFMKSSSTSYGRPIKHEMSFKIEISVAAKSSVDLSVLNSDISTPAQRSAALAAFDTGSIIADAALDELFDDVFQVIMSPVNQSFGIIPETLVADRWIENYRKDSPLPQGEYIVLSGNFQLICAGDENIDSEVGTPATTQKAIIDIDEDQGNNAGVENDLGG